MQKVAVFSAFATAPIVVAAALGIWIYSSAITPNKMAQVQPGMKAEQVVVILGSPASVEHSETTDQTLNGEVDHYPASNGEGRVIFINHAVFKSVFVPGTKS